MTKYSRSLAPLIGQPGNSPDSDQIGNHSGLNEVIAMKDDVIDA